MKNARYIVHLDMDAFFASIEQRDNPKYRSKPVVVGADPKAGKGRGVVSTCSYEARRFGIHSAMPISKAYRLCPDAVFLPVDMRKYLDVSADILSILYSFTPEVEPISIDEAFLDISGSYHLFSSSGDLIRNTAATKHIGTPLETCIGIKSKILIQTGLTASVGLAPTLMAAKIASDLQKPDGLVVVSDKDLVSFLRPLSIRKIWGLGPKTEKMLNSFGIRCIGDIADKGPDQLTRIIGRSGLKLWQLAMGMDDRVVSTESQTSSISNETTFDTDTEDQEVIDGALTSLAASVSVRLRRLGVICRTVTLKIRLSDFKTFTRSLTFIQPTNFSDVLYKAVKELYNKFDRGGQKVRLVGVKASNLISGHEKTLFNDTADSKNESVHEAIDKINDKFGEDCMYRAKTVFYTKNRGIHE